MNNRFFGGPTCLFRRLDPEWSFEESERRLAITSGHLTGSMSGESLIFLDVQSSIPGSFENDSWRFHLPYSDNEDFTLSHENRIAMQGKMPLEAQSIGASVVMHGMIMGTIHLDAPHIEKSTKPISVTLDAAYDTILVSVEGQDPIKLIRKNEDRDPLHHVRDVFTHLNLHV